LCGNIPQFKGFVDDVKEASSERVIRKGTVVDNPAVTEALSVV
jgi:hypothetical protein